METITIAIAVYLLSFFLYYLWIRNAYSKGGVLENSEISMSDFIFCVIPIVNTVTYISAIIMISFTGKKIDINFTNFLNRFFNIKK